MILSRSGMNWLHRRLTSGSQAWRSSAVPCSWAIAPMGGNIKHTRVNHGEISLAFLQMTPIATLNCIWPRRTPRRYRSSPSTSCKLCRKRPYGTDRRARGRLITDPDQASNVKFLRPRGKVLASWRRTIAYAYTPERLFARFRYQVDATYANRLRLPAKGKLTKVNLKRGAVLAWNIVWRIGIISD
jgi:Domain of unknown function (DUF4070)